MKIELASIVSNRAEVSWLDFGLESILEKTKHEIRTTLYLARYTDEMYNLCKVLSLKYSTDLQIRGDNFPIDYVNESKHRGFDMLDSDCVMSLQPDVVLTKKDIFDKAIDEASEYFDSKYCVNISSDHANDTCPMGITIHTRLGWNKLGCEDVNFYPCNGVEHDYHRRAYLEYGLDPTDTERYNAPLEGIATPEWTHRVWLKGLYHINKPWNYDERIRPPRLVNWSNAVLSETVLLHSQIPYHLAKWGGMLRFEQFTTPFNNPRYNNKISWEDHLNPYPDQKIPTLQGLLP